MTNTFTKAFSKRYFYAVGFLLFFLPLVFGSNTSELYEFPKVIFFYVFTILLMTVFALGYLFFDPKLGGFSAIKPISYPVLFFALSFVISTIISWHMYTSVWGYYTRFNDCLVFTLCGLGLYLIVKTKLVREDVVGILKLVSFQIIPISLFSYAQYLGNIQGIWSGNSLPRAFSSFGQPNWLAQYLVIVLFVVLYFALVESNWILWVTLFFLGFGSIWLSFSLSGLVGFIIAFLVFAFLYRKLLFEKKIIYRFGGLFVACTLFAILHLGIFKERTQDMFIEVKKLISSAVTVLAQENSYQLSDPGFIRTGLWKSTFNLITTDKKIFFFGAGPETYPYTFQKFRGPDLNYSSEWNFVFNKPHNYFLELWAEQGLVGLITYLILIVWIIVKTPRYLTPGLIGFLVTNLFGWPSTSAAVFIWFLAGVADLVPQTSVLEKS